MLLPIQLLAAVDRLFATRLTTDLMGKYDWMKPRRGGVSMRSKWFEPPPLMDAFSCFFPLERETDERLIGTGTIAHDNCSWACHTS